MTPSFLTSAAAYWRGVELKQRTWREAAKERIRRIEAAMFFLFEVSVEEFGEATRLDSMSLLMSSPWGR